MAKASDKPTPPLASAMTEHEMVDALLAAHRARTFIDMHAEAPCRTCLAAVALTLRMSGTGANDTLDLDVTRAHVCDQMQMANTVIATAMDIAHRWDGGTLA